MSENKKLSCRREAARCFVSLNILLSHTMSFESLGGYGFRIPQQLWPYHFVMMAVACMTSKHQNVTYPYLIDCGTVQHILPQFIEQSVISLLSIIMFFCTISMFSFSFSLCISIQNAAQ